MFIKTHTTTTQSLYHLSEPVEKIIGPKWYENYTVGVMVAGVEENLSGKEKAEEDVL